jgi:hypothetical protein
MYKDNKKLLFFYTGLLKKSKFAFLCYLPFIAQ